MDFNFDAMNADATNANQNSGQAEQIYAKFKQGAHRIRIVPQGNETEKLPYLKLQQHSIATVDEKGNRVFRFVMCWNYVFEKFKSIGKYLAGQQKLVKEDVQLYKSYGCPFCRAMHAMDNAGIPKTEARDLSPKVSFTFNIVVRENGVNSPVKVWNASNKQFDSVMQVFKLYRDMNLNLFDATNGYDLALQATGEGLQRRYTINVIPAPVAIGLAEGTLTHNLIEVACRNFYSYADTIGWLKKGYHNKLAAINYAIPGDSIGELVAQSAIAAALGQANTPIAPANVSNGMVSSQAQKDDVFAAFDPTPVVPVKPTPPAGATMLNDGGWVHAGVLYKADGTLAF
jgi:hypothetical protein